MNNNDYRPLFPLRNKEGLDELAEELLKPYTENKPTDNSQTLDLNKLLQNVEAKAQYDGANKKALTYDQALTDIKSRGCNRFLTPAEAFTILIDSLTNPTGKSKTIAQDMLTSFGEWLNIAWQVQADKLIVYHNPENLVWNGTIYEIKGSSLKHSGQKEYNITGIPKNALIDLDKMPETFQKDMYSRKVSELPAVMRTGSKRAQVYIRGDTNIWPVARDSGIFSVNGSYYDRAVRGVHASAR